MLRSDLTSSIQDIWRHDPRTGYLNKNGENVYSFPEMRGTTEPHTFAKFKRVALMLPNLGGEFMCLDLDREWNAAPQGVAELSEYFHELSTIPDFVELVSK